MGINGGQTVYSISGLTILCTLSDKQGEGKCRDGRVNTDDDDDDDEDRDEDRDRKTDRQID